MNRTKIEWVVNPDGTPGWTWNPITGCKTGCEYCYARRIAQRFGGPDGFEPTFYPQRLAEPKARTKPSTIFVGSMTDMFGPWENPTQYERGLVYKAMREAPQHIYLMLTKWPEGSGQNGELVHLCWWLGVSVDSCFCQWKIGLLKQNAPYCRRFVSFEPLLSAIHVKPHEMMGLDWVIIGAQTGPGAVRPERAWVQEIVDAARDCQVPTFVKDNLVRLYPEFAGLRDIPYLGAKR